MMCAIYIGNYSYQFVMFVCYDLFFVVMLMFVLNTDGQWELALRGND